MKARDARFDGSFFTGVTSTGIYCRPVCRVKTPKRENCRFFGHAAQAERAGFRPCLRCRPELAPQSLVWSIQDASAILAHQAARLLDEPEAWGDATPSVELLASRLGVSDRHVRRIFEAQFGVFAAAIPADTPAAHRQAAAGRHRPAHHPDRADQRLRQRAPLQRRLRRTLWAEPDAVAPRGQPARRFGRRRQGHPPGLPAAVRRAGDAGVPAQARAAEHRSCRRPRPGPHAAGGVRRQGAARLAGGRIRRGAQPGAAGAWATACARCCRW